MKKIILVALALSLAGPGCALLDRDNLRAFNWIEVNFTPESDVLKIVAAPVLGPAALTALVLDWFVLHPASVLDDAVDDVMDFLWEDIWDSRRYASGCLAKAWWALPATPPAIAFDWLARCLFEIPNNNKYRPPGK